MWSCNALRRAVAVIWVIAGLGLSACGFEPLYARPDGNAVTPSDEMAAIRILPLQDRVGQQMHNFLRDRLNPRGQPQAPRYELQVTLTELREDLGIRKDETATRGNLTMSANFVLLDARSKNALLSGLSRSTNSFNILQDQFATLFSENDARERALRELSDDIRLRLGIYFSRARAGAS